MSCSRQHHFLAVEVETTSCSAAGDWREDRGLVEAEMQRVSSSFLPNAPPVTLGGRVVSAIWLPEGTHAPERVKERRRGEEVHWQRRRTGHGPLPFFLPKAPAFFCSVRPSWHRRCCGEMGGGEMRKVRICNRGRAARRSRGEAHGTWRACVSVPCPRGRTGDGRGGRGSAPESNRSGRSRQDPPLPAPCGSRWPTATIQSDP